jgi:hypothetical protein
MPWVPKSRAILFVKATSPPFEAAYEAYSWVSPREGEREERGRRRREEEEEGRRKKEEDREQREVMGKEGEKWSMNGE